MDGLARWRAAWRRLRWTRWVDVLERLDPEWIRQTGGRATWEARIQRLADRPGAITSWRDEDGRAIRRLLSRAKWRLSRLGPTLRAELWPRVRFRSTWERGAWRRMYGPDAVMVGAGLLRRLTPDGRVDDWTEWLPRNDRSVAGERET